MPDSASEKEVLRYAIAQEENMAQFYRSFEDIFPDSWRRVKLLELVKEEEEHKRQLKVLCQDHC